MTPLPRRGWVREPSPVTPLPALAHELGLTWLGAKRDDQIPALHGGTKVRKLDVLLAAEPWRDAPVWSSVGAIGSGHLVALSAAARELGRHLQAEMFFEPVTEGVLANLGFVASGPVSIRYHSSRAAFALRRAPTLLGWGPPAWIPPGASATEGLQAMVYAGLELAEQVARGELPPPDQVVVAAGTGATAAGLAVGLGLAGLHPTVLAVTAVERLLLPEWAIRRRVQEALATLDVRAEPAPIRLVRGFVGPGYGRESVASLAACARLAHHGLALEPLYSGKAMAALLAMAPPGRNVLFWVTCHGGLPPVAPGWRDDLPPALLARLGGAGPTRRRLLVGGLALGVAALTIGRTTGYRRLPDWDGAALAAWEAEVVAAVAEALVPDSPGGAMPVPPEEVAVQVDRYLRGMPRAAMLEVHGLMALLEHGTPTGGRLTRLTRLDAAAARQVLERLAAGPLRVAYRGIRDLCLLATWQDRRAWRTIGYPGPMVSHLGAPRRADGLPDAPSPYDRLVARPGTLPKGAL